MQISGIGAGLFWRAGDTRAEKSRTVLPPQGRVSLHFGAAKRPDEFQKKAGFPLDEKLQNFRRWADLKSAELANNPDFHVPPLLQAAQPSADQASRNAATIALYKKTFPTFFWTGTECSNGVNPQGGRIDQLEAAGVYNPESRMKQVKGMKKLGIRNVRLGIPNHRVAEDKSWRAFDKILRDFKASGAKVAVDYLHFGLPDRFADKDPSRSFFLNPQWPEHFVRYAMSATKRYYKDIDAITLINEPMITNAFSGFIWNEFYPGRENHPEFNRAYIERALLIGTAATKARLRIEEFLQSKNERKIFLHNDSCEFRPHDPEFNQYRRFINSDLILGKEWLLEGGRETDGFRKSDMYRWLVGHYVFDGLPKPEENLTALRLALPAGEKRDRWDKLDAALREIKKTHLDFQDRYKAPMTKDTVFGLDYYLACENGPGITWDSHRYASELRNGPRQGIYRLGVEYWNRYKLPLLHAETAMVDSRSAAWGTQQLMEVGQLLKSDIPLLGFTWYSLMDQMWNGGFPHGPIDAHNNPGGLIDLVTYKPRLFARTVLQEVRRFLDGKANNRTQKN